MLNVALFGKTAKQWRAENPDLKGNMRDYAAIEQLLVLTNLENLNAFLIEQNIPQQERLQKLRDTALYQLQTLSDSTATRKLDAMHTQSLLPSKG